MNNLDFPDQIQEMENQLEYSRRAEHSGHRLPLVAMVCGLCSGPAAWILAIAINHATLPAGAPDLLGLYVLALVLGASLILGLVSVGRLPRCAARRDLTFATIGIAAPVLWIIPIASLILSLLGLL